MLTHCNLTIVYNRDITCLIRSVSPQASCDADMPKRTYIIS